MHIHLSSWHDRLPALDKPFSASRYNCMMFVQRQTPKLPRLLGGMHLLCWCGQGCPGVIVVLDAYTAQGG